jgi:hypothetical protein
MHLITAAEVIRRIELYFEGGANSYRRSAATPLVREEVAT